jgi:hypothetical protein
MKSRELIKDKNFRNWSCVVDLFWQKNILCRWENNIEIDLQGGMDWIGLAQDRKTWRALVNAVMKLPVP